MMHFIKEKCVRNHYLADKLQTSGNWLAAWPGSLAVTSQIRQRVLCVRGTGSEGTHCLQGLRNNCKACRSFQFVPQVPATAADCRSNVPIPPTGAGSSPRAPPPHPPLCGARCYMHERCLSCKEVPAFYARKSALLCFPRSKTVTKRENLNKANELTVRHKKRGYVTKVECS